MLLRQRCTATAGTVAATLLLVMLLQPLALSALTVDNQLVSARNDCFERIALEAMLPFEKSFSTEDTNSLKTCKEKCIQAGEKCQTISFGVHRRGNGTCQLSSEKFGASAGRPSGVIFDPDFDLYARKTNCFDLTDDNTIPQSDSGPPGGGGGGGGGEGGGGYGGNISPTPSVLLSPRPTDGTTPLLVFNPMPSTSTTMFNDRPPPPSPPPTAYDTTLPHHPLSSVGPTHGPSTTIDGDRLYFAHDVYPLYKFPMLYEHNYPAPNDDLYIPGGYASNVPEVEDRYRPVYPVDDHVRPTASGPPRPIFGLGYGNGYSYGKPERYDPTTLHPAYGPMPQNDRDRPNYTPRPAPYPSERPPDRPLGPHGRPTGRPADYDYSTTSTTYGPRPGYDPNRMPSHDQRPPPPPPPPTSGYGAGQGQQRPGDFIDYSNRPDAPPPHVGYGGAGTSSRPPMRDPSPGPGLDYGDTGGHSDSNRYDFVRRNGTAARPGDYNDDKMISTYFNPEDYMPGSTNNKHRPGSYSNRDRVGYPMDQMKAEF